MQGHRNQDSQRASRKSSGRKRPTTTERVDSYYMTHAETASTSLEDIALDAVLRPSTSASASVNPAANPANTGAHLLHVLESLFIEDTLGATPDAKTLGFVRQLYVLGLRSAGDVDGGDDAHDAHDARSLDADSMLTRSMPTRCSLARSLARSQRSLPGLGCRRS
jgi:hypothetical protein